MSGFNIGSFGISDTGVSGIVVTFIRPNGGTIDPDPASGDVFIAVGPGFGVHAGAAYFDVNGATIGEGHALAWGADFAWPVALLDPPVAVGGVELGFIRESHGFRTAYAPYAERIRHASASGDPYAAYADRPVAAQGLKSRPYDAYVSA